MGILDALFNPSKNTDIGYGQANQRIGAANNQTNPFYSDVVSGGRQANSYLTDLLGYGTGTQSTLDALMANPAYQQQLKAGLEGVDASAAARGMSQSGDTLKALNDYGQQSFGNFRQNEIGNATNSVNLGFNGASGISGNASRLAELAIGQGQSRDAGNAAGFGNLLGIAGTAVGLGTGGGFGGGNLGRIFGSGGNNAPVQVANPWAGLRG